MKRPTLKNCLFPIMHCKKKVTRVVGKTFFYLIQTKCYLHHNYSVNLNWNNTQLYSSAKPLRNVPSSVFWFLNFCFFPFLRKTNVQEWKKNWFCYVHKRIGKKEMLAKYQSVCVKTCLQKPSTNQSCVQRSGNPCDFEKLY